MRLQGKRALVTGGGSGIGRSIALELAHDGAMVAVNDINYDAAGAVLEEIKASQCRGLAFQADVSISQQVKNMADQILKEWTGIDILVNNAGFGQLSPFDKITEEMWDRMISVHLKGAFNCIQSVIATMKAQKYGRIVNMASVAGLTGTPSHAHYSAAKGGLIGLTKALAKELAPFGITVNAIAPGMVDTSFIRDYTDEIKQLYMQRTPLGRLGKPEEVARLCCFLVSAEADFITGQVISPNGGYLI